MVIATWNADHGDVKQLAFIDLSVCTGWAKTGAKKLCFTTLRLEASSGRTILKLVQKLCFGRLRAKIPHKRSLTSQMDKLLFKLLYLQL